MATFTIKAGRHAHTFWPVSFLPWWCGRDTVTRTRRIKFGEGCIYDSPAYNAEDVNKLWGLSFGFLPTRISTWIEPTPPLGDDPQTHRWVAPEHWNSARFGWVWSVSKQAWKQLAYLYADGVKNQYLDEEKRLRYPEVCLVYPGQTIDETISYDRRNGEVILYVREADSGKLLGLHVGKLPPNLPLHGWRLGLWFGGSRPAPHTMQVKDTLI